MPTGHCIPDYPECRAALVAVPAGSILLPLPTPRKRCSCTRATAQSKLEGMGSVKEIEEAALRLSAAELAAFRVWFAELDAEAWDRRIEDDVAAGRLDALADEALEDLRAGRCTER